MRKEELTLFSYEILGLIGSTGAGPHDLKQMVDRGRLVRWAGESQYYTEPKRLAKLGYLEAHKEPGKTRERTVYSLTDKGLEALRAWATTPVEMTPVKSEALTRMLIGDLVGRKATREGIATLRADIAVASSHVDAMEAEARELPHRREYLLLAADLLRRTLAVHLEWIEEVERELG